MKNNSVKKGDVIVVWFSKNYRVIWGRRMKDMNFECEEEQ